MNTSPKIRILFLLLTLSFIATALTLRLTFQREDILLQDSGQIEARLHDQEQFARRFLNNPANYTRFRSVHRDSGFALSLLDIRQERSLYFYTFQDHKLLFWGANHITPETDAGLREGSNIIAAQNGWYEAIKRSSGGFSVVCYIPIKARYPIQNTYLRNTFAPSLIKTDNLDIAGLGDEPVYNVRSSLDNRYLFSLKLKPTLSPALYSGLELLMWGIAILLSCFFVNAVCAWVAAKGRVKSSILLLCLFFLFARLLTLRHNWFMAHFDLPIFDPKHYGAGPAYPSLGDLFLNVIASSWCILFAYRLRDRIVTPGLVCPLWMRVAVFLLLVVFYTTVVLHVEETFSSLVVNSSIRFDVNNILNMNVFSWLGVLVLCVGVMNVYVLLIVVLAIVKDLHLYVYYRFLFPLAVAAGAVTCFLLSDISIFYLLFALVVGLCAWQTLRSGAAFNPAMFAVILVLFATICSMKLSEYRFSKDRESRKLLAGALEMSDDPSAVLYFDSLEQRIVTDQTVLRYFKGPDRDYAQLRNRLQKFYFDGYLTRYELNSYQFGPDGSPLDGSRNDDLNYYRELVVSGTIKVSRFFYRVNNTFGIRHFFALLPIRENGADRGTLVVDLSSGTFESPDAFPRVLADNKIDEAENIRDYSFAFYKDNDLVNQYGVYPYKVRADFGTSKETYGYVTRDAYDHIIYRPNSRNLIVVSASVPGVFLKVGSVSFLFLALLFFSIACVLINWAWKNLIRYQPDNGSRWKYLSQGGYILYRTRIQVSIVLSVILTLVVVGLVTYFNIVDQYERQQRQSVTDRLERITAAFENQLQEDGRVALSNEQFNGFADVNTADLSYFSKDGHLYYTTQPKIFNADLVSSRINTRAYLYMNVAGLSEYINEEQVGQMFYIAGYRPVRNTDHQTVGYLSLPYFSNQHDLELRIGEFLNSMVNVYALVLVAIGFFAVFMANQITNPLAIIQRSLSQIKIGTHNTPITWKRNDEIGSLIREYNTMIAELEESTTRLARSERETAWKEMAKQVAHEIKNPLTPLKLGVQLLDKSWRENDPNFNKKFERFSKSFIEQIESLAHIATEFSNFAKMPETSLESVILHDIVEQSIEVYSKMSYVSISFDNRLGNDAPVKGDRDQLLRIFNNLIKNATEAIPAGRYGEIRIVAERRNNTAYIALSDNGKGIPDGLKERIFNPNFTTKSSGTGLGLAFVKQAIENMAGSIRLTTGQDTGTTFYITLPLAS